MWCTPLIREAEAGGSLVVRGHPGLQRDFEDNQGTEKTLSLKKTKQKTNQPNEWMINEWMNEPNEWMNIWALTPALGKQRQGRSVSWRLAKCSATSLPLGTLKWQPLFCTCWVPIVWPGPMWSTKGAKLKKGGLCLQESVVSCNRDAQGVQSLTIRDAQGGGCYCLIWSPGMKSIFRDYRI